MTRVFIPRLGLASCLGVVGACASTNETPSVMPEDHAGERSERREAVEPRAVEAPAAAQRPTARVPRDRGPAEERRKMAASRERSRKAREQLPRGLYNDAIAGARQALELHELNPEAMIVMAEAYLRLGKHELAATVTSSALAIDPKLLRPEEISQAWNLKGFAFLAAGQEGLATDAFRKAAESDPKNAAAWNNLGVRYLASGDDKTAVSCFKWATEVDPAFQRAYVNYGAALRQARDVAGAKQALDRAIALRPDDPAAHFTLGALLLDADPFPGLDTKARLEAAIASFSRYRQLAKKAPLRGRSTWEGQRAGPEGEALVSDARAAEYIDAASRSLEREARRLGRAQDREGRPAESATGAAETSTAGSRPEAPGDKGGSSSATSRPAPTPADGPPSGGALTTPQRPGAVPARGSSQPVSVAPQSPSPVASPSGPRPAVAPTPPATDSTPPSPVRPTNPPTPTKSVTPVRPTVSRPTKPGPSTVVMPSVKAPTPQPAPGGKP